jgi:hypothetical protein
METSEEDSEKGEEYEKCETAKLSQTTDSAASLQERGKGFLCEVQKCWGLC